MSEAEKAYGKVLAFLMNNMTKESQKRYDEIVPSLETLRKVVEECTQSKK